jgi:hypothetical protein
MPFVGFSDCVTICEGRTTNGYEGFGFASLRSSLRVPMCEVLDPGRDIACLCLAQGGGNL